MMGRIRISHMAFVAVLGLVLLITLAACSSDDDPAPDPTAGPTSAADASEVRLTANGCTADCAFDLDESFTLALEIITAPESGYIGAQSMIDFGDLLVYDESQREPKEEILWADCEEAVAVRSQLNPKLVAHGCLAGLIPPIPVSHATGTFVQFTLTCSTEPSSTTLHIFRDGERIPGEILAASSSGTTFMQADGETRSAPTTTDLVITCS